jgi:hypothetical protein
MSTRNTSASAVTLKNQGVARYGGVLLNRIVTSPNIITLRSPNINSSGSSYATDIAGGNQAGNLNVYSNLIKSANLIERSYNKGLNYAFSNYSTIINEQIISTLYNNSEYIAFIVNADFEKSIDVLTTISSQVSLGYNNLNFAITSSFTTLSATKLSTISREVFLINSLLVRYYNSNEYIQNLIETNFTESLESINNVSTQISYGYSTLNTTIVSTFNNLSAVRISTISFQLSSISGLLSQIL